MRDNSIGRGAFAALAAAVLLAGCSVSDLPYPKLGEIVRGEDASLSDEEKAAMIEELKNDQKRHRASAEADIEKR
ncbi:MAG: hypothetical protein ACLFPA_09620 [Dichotomicrobium sp.]